MKKVSKEERKEVVIYSFLYYDEDECLAEAYFDNEKEAELAYTGFGKMREAWNFRKIKVYTTCDDFLLDN